MIVAFPDHIQFLLIEDFIYFPEQEFGKTGHAPWQPSLPTDQNNLYSNLGRGSPRDHFQITFKSAKSF